MVVLWAHGASFKMVGPPSFWKNLNTEPNFQYVSETQQKSKIHHTSAHVWCSCNKLCNAFDEAFLLDVSILFEPKHDTTKKIPCAPSEDSYQLMIIAFDLLCIRIVWSDYLLCALRVAMDQRFPHADSEYSGRSVWMPRLIWLLAGRTRHFIGFVVLMLTFGMPTCVYSSRDMTKPTKWLCAQRRLRSAWACAQQLLFQRTSKSLSDWADAQADLSLLGAHSFCMFCHDVAHFTCSSSLLSLFLRSVPDYSETSHVTRKPISDGLRPGKTPTGLHSHRS